MTKLRQTVVLLHGFGDSPECWGPFEQALTAFRPVAVVCPAAPGHDGLPPDSAGLTLPALVAAAESAVERVAAAAGGPVIVGGHSMGAATATALAARRPDLVAALFCEDPPWGWPPDDGPDATVPVLNADYREWIHGLQAGDDDSRERWCREHNPGWPDEEYAPWARAKAAVHPQAFDPPLDLDRYRWRKHVGGVTCPAALVVGDPEYGSVTATQTAAEVAERANWTVTRLSGVGHDVRRQARAETVAALGALIDRAAGQRLP